MQGIHVGAAIRRQPDHFDVVGLGPVQPDHVMFARPLGLEPGQAIVAGNFDQAPVLCIELPLGLELLDPVSDIANFRHTTHRLLPGR